MAASTTLRVLVRPACCLVLGAFTFASRAATAQDTPAASTSSAPEKSKPKKGDETSEGMDPLTLHGIVALVSAAGAAAGGFYALGRVAIIRNQDGWNAYRSGIPRHLDACESAEGGFVVDRPGAFSPEDFDSRCNEGRNLTIVQAVMFPVAAILGGLGLYLVSAGAADEAAEEKAASLELAPLATTQGGGALLRGTLW
jgi:hypothetical protein